MTMTMKQARRVYLAEFSHRDKCPVCPGRKLEAETGREVPTEACKSCSVCRGSGTVRKWSTGAPGFRTFARDTYARTATGGKLSDIISRAA